MKYLFAALSLVALLFALSGCGEFECTEPPDTYKGAELSGCSGDGSDIQCCSYSDSSCSYTLCKNSCTGEFTEESWACA